MIKKIIPILMCLCSITSFSQEVFVNFGKNITTYNYKNDKGQSNPHLRSGTGVSYEVGYEHVFKKGHDLSTLSYAISLNLNEFNALGGDAINNYSWQTNYLGIKNALLVTLFNTTHDTFEAKLSFAINTTTLVSGKQVINNTIYDLKGSNEFKGVFVQPILGVQLRYRFSDKIMANAGYEFSKAYNFSNTSPEKLSFSNKQLQFGINFSIL